VIFDCVGVLFKSLAAIQPVLLLTFPYRYSSLSTNTDFDALNLLFLILFWVSNCCFFVPHGIAYKPLLVAFTVYCPFLAFVLLKLRVFLSLVLTQPIGVFCFVFWINT